MHPAHGERVRLVDIFTERRGGQGASSRMGDLNIGAAMRRWQVPSNLRTYPKGIIDEVDPQVVWERDAWGADGGSGLLAWRYLGRVRGRVPRNLRYPATARGGSGTHTSRWETPRSDLGRETASGEKRKRRGVPFGRRGCEWVDPKLPQRPIYAGRFGGDYGHFSY